MITFDPYAGSTVGRAARPGTLPGRSTGGVLEYLKEPESHLARR